MTEPQTFYAVLDECGNVFLSDNTNANKADEVARREARQWGIPHRVIAYTVIATYEGTDE